MKKTKPNRRRTFGPALLQELARAKAPAKEIRYFDTQAAGFFLRHMPSGAASYAVQLARGNAKSLGDVRGWPNAEDARAAALEARKRHRAGLPVTRQELRAPQASAGAGPAIGSIFGLRAKFAADGVEIAGAYRATRKDKSHVEAIALDYFVRYAGPATPIASITADDVRAYFAAEAGRRNLRRKAGGKIVRDSMKRHLTVLRGAFRWAMAQEPPLVAANPCDGVKLAKSKKDLDDNAPTRWLAPDEETRLRAVLAARDADLIARGCYSPVARRDGCIYADHLTPLVLLAVNTGGRRGALHRLQWSDIERLPYHRVRFLGGKGKTGRTYYVPLNAEARAILAAWRPRDAAPSDLVFPNADGLPFVTVSTAWFTVRLAAGLPDFRFHDLRHTFASKLVQRGESLRAVALLMGHRSQRMTERYANLAPEHGIAGVEKLNQPAKRNGIGVDGLSVPAELRGRLESYAAGLGVAPADVVAMLLTGALEAAQLPPAA